MRSNYRKWANIAVCSNTIAIFFDSYYPRGGSQNANAVTVRSYDVYAAYNYLLNDPTVNTLVDPLRISAVGWSQGGTAVIAAVSSTDIHYTNDGSQFYSAAAYYPDCGLYLEDGVEAFGGVANSSYCPYCPLEVLAASATSQYSSGSCQDRIDVITASGTCPGAANWTQTVYWTNRDGARDGFDQSTANTLNFWAQVDIDASRDAAPSVLSAFGLTCSNPLFYEDPDNTTGSFIDYPYLTGATDPAPSGGAFCVNDTDCGGIGQGRCYEFECVCNPRFANVSCNYARKNRQYVGGMQIGLTFVGVGGVGNFILGNNGPAIGQLILVASYYFLCIACCLLAPLCFLGKKGVKAYRLILSLAGCLISIAFLAGWIWSIVDGALMLQGKIADSNGFATYNDYYA